MGSWQTVCIVRLQRPQDAVAIAIRFHALNARCLHPSMSDPAHKRARDCVAKSVAEISDKQRLACAWVRDAPAKSVAGMTLSQFSVPPEEEVSCVNAQVPWDNATTDAYRTTSCNMTSLLCTPTAVTNSMAFNVDRGARSRCRRRERCTWQEAQLSETAPRPDIRA